jgi:glycosyltransferase involved in cell wall biosynthesis
VAVGGETVDGEIIALIPAYNEAVHIEQVVKAALAYMPVVVVDDGSVDGTPGAAALAGAKVVAHRSNLGKGAALNTGFAYATERGVAAAVTLDADGQHDPTEIPHFVDAFRAGRGDIVIGQRRFSQMPLIRQMGNRIGTGLLNLAMGHRVPDNQSGYRLLSGAVMRQVRTTSPRFEAEVEILLRAEQAGFHIAWIPIRTIYGDEMSHYQPLPDSLLFLKMVWRIWLARRRGYFD